MNPTPPAAPANRDDRADTLKAVCILGVVTIHTSWPGADVLRFCVPVFVSLWAYYCELGLARRAPGEAWPYVARRFGRLFVAYAFWTAVYHVLTGKLGLWGETPPRIIVGVWFGGYGWPGQYYFIVLFQLTLLMPWLRKLVTPRSLGPLVLVAAAVSVGVNYWLIRYQYPSASVDRLFVYWLPYVFLGVAFARGYPRARLALLPLALALAASPAEYEPLHAEFHRASSYQLVSVITGTVALLLALAPRRGDAPTGPGPAVLAPLRYVGRHSFAVFVGHLLVFEAAGRLGLAGDDSPAGLAAKSTLIAAAVAGSLALGWALRRLGLGVLVGA